MNRALPETLTVQVPFTIRKRGGRKEFVLPEGAVATRAKPDSTLVKALARAFRWQRMLDSGAFATIGDLALHEQIAPSYMTRIMRLTLLAPEVIEGIVDGRMARGLVELLEPFPVEWARQARQRGNYGDDITPGGTLQPLAQHEYLDQRHTHSAADR